MLFSCSLIPEAAQASTSSVLYCKGQAVTGTAAGARNEQTQETLSLCETNANFHILMVVLTPPPKWQKFVLLSANKRTRGQAGLMWVFVKSSLLYQPSSSEWGKGHSQMASASQLWWRSRFTAAGPKDCTPLALPLLCSPLEPSGSQGPIQFQPLHYNN